MTFLEALSLRLELFMSGLAQVCAVGDWPVKPARAWQDRSAGCWPVKPARAWQDRLAGCWPVKLAWPVRPSGRWQIRPARGWLFSSGSPVLQHEGSTILYKKKCHSCLRWIILDVKMKLFESFYRQNLSLYRQNLSLSLSLSQNLENIWKC